MHIQWWPATVLDPQTAVTFECLRQFEKINAFRHVNAMDYYQSLMHMTDPEGLCCLLVSNVVLLRVPSCS
jgi:hypothetical protein